MFGKFPLPKLLFKVFLGLSPGIRPVVPRHHGFRQIQFRLLGMALPDRIEIFGGQQFIVPEHQVVADRHDLAEHVRRLVFQGNEVAEALAHFSHAVRPFQERHGDDDLRDLAPIALEIPAHEQVKRLIGAAQFDVGLECHGIIALHQRI